MISRWILLGLIASGAAGAQTLRIVVVEGDAVAVGHTRPGFLVLEPVVTGEGAVHDVQEADRHVRGARDLERLRRARPRERRGQVERSRRALCGLHAFDREIRPREDEGGPDADPVHADHGG